MAKKTETSVVEETAPVIIEDAYPVADLIAASRDVFGAPQECAVAAFKPLKKKTMTVSEAKTIIDNFMKKEVK